MSQFLEKPLPPILDPSRAVYEPSAHGQDMQDMPEGATSFIRPVDIALEAPSGANMLTVYPHLSEVLTRTDEELAKIAEFCGARIVKHTWYLLRPSPAHGRRLEDNLTLDFDSYRKMGIPRRNALVAEVDLLRDVQPLSGEPLERAQEAVKSYYNEYDAYAEDETCITDYRGVVLSAIDSEQFVSGVSAAEGPEASRDVWLPDIEPRLIWAM